MNKGINKNSTYKEINVKHAGNIKINLNKNESGVFINIPLYSTTNKETLTYGLKYSTFMYHENETINFLDQELKKFTILENSITVTDTYGKVDTYEKENDEYINNETKLKITYDTNYIYIKDKYENCQKYTKETTNYQPIKTLTYREKEVISGGRKENNKIIYEQYGNVKITLENNIILITKNNEFINKIEIINNTLEKQTHNYYRYINETWEFLYSTEYIIKSDEIKITDIYTGYNVTLEGEREENTFLTKKIIYKYNDNIIKTEEINYYTTSTQNYTKIKESTKSYTNKITDYHFENNLLKKIIDYKGRSKIYNYDNNKKLIEGTNWLYNDYESSFPNSILCEYETNNFENITDTFTQIISNTTQYSNIYGQKLLKINEGTITKTINHRGFKDSFLTLKLWSISTKGNEPLKITITLINNSITVDTITYEFNHKNMEVDTKEIKAIDQYTKIKIEIEVKQDNVYNITGLCLYDKPSINHYYYDEEENLIKKTFNQSEIEYSYEKYLKLAKTKDTYVVYNRDTNGYIVKTIKPYGVLNEINYDENNNIIKETKNYKDKYQEVSYEYETNTDYLKKIITEEETNIIYTTDEITGNITKEEIKKDDKTSIKTYEYDKYNELTKQTDNNEVININKTKEKDVIQLKDNYKYIYSYNEIEQLTKIELISGSTTTTLLENIYENDKIRKQKKYGKEKIEYEYDGDYNEHIKSITTQDGTISFTYDTNDNITKITNNDEELTYSYDKENNIERYNDTKIEEKYQYDETNQIKIKTEKQIEDDTYKKINNYIYEQSKVINIEEIEEKYYNDKMWITFNDDPLNEGNDKCLRLYKKENNEIKYINGVLSGATTIDTKEKIHYIDLTKDESVVGFDLTKITETTENNNHLSFGLWIKITSGAHGNLGEIYNNVIYGNTIKIALYSDKKVGIRITDSTKTEQEFITTKKLEIDKWNFFLLKIIKSGTTNTIKVKINDEENEYEYDNNKVIINNNCLLTIGNTKDETTGYCKCQIGSIIYTSKEITEEEIKELYETTKNYIYQNSETEEENSYFNITTIIEHQKVLVSPSTTDEVYPLNQTLNSLEGKKPYIYRCNDGTKYNGYQTYKYDKDLCHSAYLTGEQTLIYETTLKETGTVSLKTKIHETKNDIQTILEIYETASKNIIIYRNKFKNLYVSFMGTTTYLGMNLENDELIDVVVSYYKTNDLTSGMVRIYNHKTDTTKTTYINGTHLLESPKYIAVGCRYNIDSYKLYGIVTNMVVTPGYYFSSGELQETYLKNLVYKEEYNEIGKLTKETKPKEEITYKYKTQEINNNQKTTNQINEEIHKIDQTTITYKYEYDFLGRITKKETYENETIENTEEYSYTNTGKLTTYKNTKKDKYIIYTYDEYGNIKLTNQGRISDGVVEEVKGYTYNEKNELTNYNGTILTYNDEMELTTIGEDVNIEWENNKLKKYNTYSYEYDKIRGQRITKEVEGQTTEYYYNNEGELIYEKEGNDYIRYYYNNKGKLIRTEAKVGYTTYKLEITRNILGEITGLINESTNEIVIKYSYNPYGKVEVEGSLKDIYYKLNRIIYKGYYYDKETELYFVSSRYYSPELCRWISPDDVEYLDLSSINGMNLYVYANFNSIWLAYSDLIVGANKIVTNNNPQFNITPLAINPSLTNNSLFSLKPLTFSIGVVTHNNPKLPKWIDLSAFYIGGHLGSGVGYSKSLIEKGSFGLSFASLDLGIVNMKCDVLTFDDDTALYLGLGAINANTSLGLGLSANAEIVSFYFGAKLNEYVSIDGKVYVGWGVSIDFSNGLKIGIAAGVGFEIAINL